MTPRLSPSERRALVDRLTLDTVRRLSDLGDPPAHSAVVAAIGAAVTASTNRLRDRGLITTDGHVVAPVAEATHADE